MSRRKIGALMGDRASARAAVLGARERGPGSAWLGRIAEVSPHVVRVVQFSGGFIEARSGLTESFCDKPPLWQKKAPARDPGVGARETMNPPVYSDSANRQQPLITHGAGVPAAWRYWPRSVGPHPG